MTLCVCSYRAQTNTRMSLCVCSYRAQTNTRMPLCVCSYRAQTNQHPYAIVCLFLHNTDQHPYAIVCLFLQSTMVKTIRCTTAYNIFTRKILSATCVFMTKHHPSMVDFLSMFGLVHSQINEGI